MSAPPQDGGQREAVPPQTPAPAPQPAQPPAGYGYPPAQDTPTVMVGRSPWPAQPPMADVPTHQQQTQRAPMPPQQPLPHQQMPQHQIPQGQQPYQVRPGLPQPPAPFTPPPPGQEPDWTRMADQYESKRKRKRTLGIAGAVVGVLAIGGVVAFGLSQHHDKPVASPTGSTPTHTAPSGGSSNGPGPGASGTATAKSGGLHTGTVFSAKTLQIDGRTFTKRATANTTPCSRTTSNGLGPVVSKHGCTQALLATYTSGTDSVTVSVLVFPTADAATAASTAFAGQTAPLVGTGVSAFCKAKPCAITHAAQGRFLYTTVAGPNSGGAGDKDAPSIAAGHGIAAYVLSRLLLIH